MEIDGLLATHKQRPK